MIRVVECRVGFVGKRVDQVADLVLVLPCGADPGEGDPGVGSGVLAHQDFVLGEGDVVTESTVTSSAHPRGHNRWRRAKSSQQYRLYFPYHEGERLIVHAWLNNPPPPLTAHAVITLRWDQEAAAFTSSTTFFSTPALHLCSAYDTGHRSPSSRLAASWKPRVEYRYLNLPASWKKMTTFPSALA